LKLCPKLTEINLSNTSIAPEIIKPTLDEMPKLEHLDISDNALGDAGLIALSDALSSNTVSLSHVLTLPRKEEH
jgi:Ran GTPase-activating protein (RanGAP) involved in mRNA processing and transport